MDRFYTSVDEADRLIRTISSHLLDLVIEPSAGKGAFVLALEEASIDVLAYNIAPDPAPVCKTPIVQADFLSLRTSDIRAARPSYSPSSTAFVGNPPFGVRGRLAVQFVHHCLELADDVWMILPPSFRKRSMADKVGNGELVEVYNLASTTYATPVGDIDVPSFLMHWHVCDGAEATVKRHKEEGEAIDSLPFEFLGWRTDITGVGADAFNIRRVGGNAGHATIAIDVSAQSNYLCRAKDGYRRDDIVAWINRMDFPERDWSVGPRSLSKGEIALRLMTHPI